MAEKFDITVIMGVFNCEKYLREAIDSILAQAYTSWKMVICDDGSSDGTVAIVNEYVQKYPEKIILVKNEKNMGLNHTLNHCLKYADTEFIARMDGDDISVPERFEKEIVFLREHPEYSIVSCPMYYFDDEGVFKIGDNCGEPDVSSIAKGTPFCHAPCMVRKEAYDKVGGYTEDEKYLRVEDYNLWVKMYAEGYRGFSLNEPLYKMRDDRSAQKRRKYKYRINEARVSRDAVKLLKLKKFNYIWSLRPLLVGLCPSFLYNYLHKNRGGKAVNV